MGTFMLMQIPRSAVCADRITEVLDTESSVVPPATAVSEVDLHGHLDLEDVSFTLPRRRAAGPLRRRPQRPPGPDRGDHRLHRRRQVDPGQPGAAALRRDDRLGPDRRRRRPGPRPRGAVVADRAGAAAGLPVHRHDPEQPAARQARRDRRGAVARARGRAGARLRRADAGGARRADRPGRHQRLRWPAPAARDRAGPGPPTRDLPVRRRVLGPRPRDRRQAPRGAASRDPRRPRSWWWRSASPRSATPT